jgi:integrase
MRRSKRGRPAKGARLYVRDNRFVILDQGPDGRRREIGTGASAGDRAAAEKALAAYLAEKHVPDFGSGHPSEVLITDVLAYYAEHHAPKVVRRDSLARSLTVLGDFFATKTANDMTPQLCDQFVDWRIHLGDARGSNKWEPRGPNTSRILKPATARNDLTVLQAALRFAWQNRKITQAMPVAKPPPSEPRVRSLTRPEAARLLLGALGWDLRTGERHSQRINRYLARFILIGFYTGTRSGRIRRLQWVENLQGGWVDLERGVLHRRAPNEAETKKRAPSVPISGRLLAHLRRWRKLTARYVIEHNGVPVANNVHGGMKSACRLAGLTDVTPHTLRHTATTWMLERGLSPWRVGKYVGMSAQMVERVYGHATDEMQRATANAIGTRNISGPHHEMPTKIRGKA